MPMEIYPIPGQPGLFHQGLEGRARARWTATGTRRKARQHRDPGLEGTRWTSTVGGATYHAPFGNRGRRSALAGMAALDQFAALPLPEAFIKANSAYSQGDVAPGQVVGVYFTLIIYTPGPLIAQQQLDSMYRSLFAQLGYDVSSSVISAGNLKYAWQQDNSVPAEGGSRGWVAKIVSGPKEVVGMDGPSFFSSAMPTDADLKGSPTVAQIYKLVARPKDGLMSSAKVTAISVGVRPLSAQLKAAYPDTSTDTLIDVRGVGPAPAAEQKPLMAGIGGILGLIGVGWLSYLALTGKSTVEKKPLAGWDEDRGYDRKGRRWMANGDYR